MRILLLLCISAAALPGKYANLIAVSGGEAVYFQVPTGPASYSWYLARTSAGIVSITPVDGPLVDADDPGAVLARGATGSRQCGFAGSTCWLAPSCSGNYSLDGPGFHHGGAGYFDTQIRLSRSGRYAWIVQTSCAGVNPPGNLAAPMRGLYEPDSLRPIAQWQVGALAAPRIGRRAITDRGQALVIANAQLEWLDAGGVHLIRNVYGALEAVADAQGDNIVYTEGPNSELHWVTGPDWLGARDVKLGLQGTAPALTDDGSRLLFLDADSRLRMYVFSTAELRTLGSERVGSFSTAGNAAFATSEGGSLVRFDLAGGGSSVWLEPVPEIGSIGAAEVMPNWCTHICYGPTEYPKIISPGMLVVMRGSALGGAGWLARIGELETPVLPLSDAAAWFQVPHATNASATTVEIFKPGLTFGYKFGMKLQSPAVACLGTLHQDFSRAVTASDPARIGEAVHIFLTGLEGAEAVADGAPNPTDRLIPVLNAPPLLPLGVERLFFGLAPGLIGIQQLDLRILASPSGTLFDGPAYECSVPPVAP